MQDDVRVMKSVEANDFMHTAIVARHVSADGCQLVLGGEEVSLGARFGFHLAGFPPVHGTVRWIVADRAGFVFDQPLCRDSQRALAGQAQPARGLALFKA